MGSTFANTEQHLNNNLLVANEALKNELEVLKDKNGHIKKFFNRSHKQSCRLLKNDNSFHNSNHDNTNSNTNIKIKKKKKVRNDSCSNKSYIIFKLPSPPQLPEQQTFTQPELEKMETDTTSKETVAAPED
jgi:hypothetical protein